MVKNSIELKWSDSLDTRVLKICRFFENEREIPRTYLNEAVEYGPKSEDAAIRFRTAWLARIYNDPSADKIFNDLVDYFYDKRMYDYAAVTAMKAGFESNARELFIKFLESYSLDLKAIRFIKSARNNRRVEEGTELKNIIEYLRKTINNPILVHAAKKLGLVKQLKETEELSEDVLK